MSSSGVPIQVWDGELGELVASSTAGGGTALTNGTPSFIMLHDGVAHAFLTAVSLAGGATAVQFSFNPYLAIYKTTDLFVTETDYSQVAQQPNPLTAVVLDALNTLANGNELVIGSHIPFRGVAVTMSTASTTASVLTVQYWNGAAWTSISASDGTATAGHTFGQSGNVTWTVPSAWKMESLVNTGLGISGAIAQSYRPLYWTRWQVSGILSATTRASQMLSMSRFPSNYAEMIAGQTFKAVIAKGLGRTGCIEATVGTGGTGVIIVNTASRYGTGYLS